MDSRIQEFARAWRASPFDQGLLRDLIAARRRAGERVPAAELDAQLLPATVFRSSLSLTVYVEDPEGRVTRVGITPGRVDVPACRLWWVRPEAARLNPELVSEVVALGVPGLVVRHQTFDAESLELLAQLEGLRHLSLQGCWKVTDGVLEALGVFEDLESLDLSEVLTRPSSPYETYSLADDSFGRAGLSALGSLPSLTRLKLVHPTQLTADDLEVLGELDQLTVLRLEEVHVAGEALAHLAPLKHLRVLSLIRCNTISGKGLKHLPALPALRRLELRDCKALRASGLSAIARCSGLESLQLALVKPCDAKSLAFLSDLERLRELAVEVKDAAAAERVAESKRLLKLDLQGDVEDAWEVLGRGLGDLRELKARLWSEEEVAALATFASLESLDLDDYDRRQPLESSDLLPLGTVAGLRRLRLRTANTDGSTLESVSRLEHLEHLRLTLDGDGLGGDEWGVLKRLPRLRSLDANCSPEGLSALRGAGLVELGLDPAHDGHAEELSHWSALETLELRSCDFSEDEGEGEDALRLTSLDWLAELPALRTLALESYGGPFSDLEPLLALRKLERLRLSGSACLSHDERGRLSEALPHCTFLMDPS